MPEDKKWKVYIHTNNINKKRYVGITSQEDPNRRWEKGNGYLSNPHFYASIKKYGWDNFDHRIVQDGLTEQEAKNLEVLLIGVLRTQSGNYGYNMTKGGDGRSHGPTTCLPVCQFTMNGDYVAEYPSLASATNTMGSKTISAMVNACKGRHFSAFGYCWRYKSDCSDLLKVKQDILTRKEAIYNHRISVGRSEGREICQLDIYGNLIFTYRSIGYAAEAIGRSPTTISSACLYNHICAGYRWMYKEEYQKILDGEETFIVIKPSISSILQFDLNGNYLKEYPNATEAAEETGCDHRAISRACATHGKTGGYFWRYYYDYQEGELLVDPKDKFKKPICQFDLDNNFIAKYESSMEVQRNLGYDSSGIRRSCSDKYQTSFNYIWRDIEDCIIQEDGTYKPKEPYIPREYKHIYQFQENLDFVKEYSRVGDASLETGISPRLIASACRAYGKTQGFLWRYEDGIQVAEDGTITPILNYEHRHVIQLSEDFEFIKEHASTKIAALNTGFNGDKIRSAAYRKVISNGYRWIWADEYEDYMRSKGYEITAISA